ncbi:MAG TPA: vitamin B12-dependent ribonucleotide reductase, partial [Hyphomicrobium sp.]|nr:vitamin B12-dependent ribonucleotide reductase [Hyphomicrobium sp.]
DLAHVDPREIVGETGLGSSDEETDEQLDLDLPASVTKVVSKGFMRGNLRLASGGRTHAHDADPVAALDDIVSAYPAVEGSTALYTDGATAFKAETEVMYQRTTVSETKRVSTARTASDRMAEARLRGYEGVSCPECLNFTMVRNGTCLKCDTCGSTSGCS